MAPRVSAASILSASIVDLSWTSVSFSLHMGSDNGCLTSASAFYWTAYSSTQPAQENCFSDLTDTELVTELSTYREHILDRLGELQKEVLAGGNRLGAYFGASLCAEPKIRQN